jgi:hypothetical protein
VPDLGINLISVKKLCEEGLEGVINSTGMYFNKDSTRVLEGKPNNGLYLVTHITERFQETAF